MIHSLKCGLVPDILECGSLPPLSRLPQCRHTKRLAETVGIARREQALALQGQRTVRRPSSPPTSVPFPYRFVFTLSLFSSINSTPYRKNRGRGIPLCSLTSHRSRVTNHALLNPIIPALTVHSPVTPAIPALMQTPGGGGSKTGSFPSPPSSRTLSVSTYLVNVGAPTFRARHISWERSARGADRHCGKRAMRRNVSPTRKRPGSATFAASQGGHDGVPTGASQGEGVPRMEARV